MTTSAPPIIIQTTETSTTIMMITSITSASSLISTASSIMTTIPQIKTSITITDKSLTIHHLPTINTQQTSISTLTVTIADSTLSTTQMAVSINSEQILDSISITPTLIATNTDWIETIEMISPKTTGETAVITQSKLVTMIKTTTASTVISRSRTSAVKTANLSFSPSTTTKSSQKSRNILLPILFSLLFLIMCVTIIALIVCFLHCWRQRRYLIDEDASTTLDKTNIDNWSEDSSKSPSSLLSTQYSKIKTAAKPPIDFRQNFDDSSF